MPGFRDTVAALVARLQWAPSWLVSLLLLGLSIVAAVVVHALVLRAFRRALSRREKFWSSLVVRARRPTQLAMIVAALSVAVPLAPLTPPQMALARHLLLIAFIGLTGWTTLLALDIVAALYLRRFQGQADDNLLARKHLTQVRILRRAIALLIGLFTVAFALMTINGVRQWGVSLLAAGGAAGVLVGLALQPLLTNLIAGIQIAITQPIRLDDAIIVEGEWGNVEEIGSTYVVVRLWDLRRLVVPLSYFIQKPFQNWTRESAALIGTAMLYVDHAAPVSAMRARLEQLVRASSLWDGKVVNLAVTDVRETCLEVRCLVSARNGGQTFDLRTHVREAMMAWLAAEYPSALVRRRMEFVPVEASAANEVRSQRLDA